MADEVQQQPENISNMLYNFLRDRQELIHLINEIADKLDEHHKNVKITKVVTGSTGIVGTLVSLSGLALTPLTGGLSLALTFGGGIMAAASGTAHLGSDIVESRLIQSYINRLDKLCQADEKKYFRFAGYLNENIEKLRNSIPDNISDKTKLDICNEISSLANLGCSIIRVARVASLTTRSIRVFSVTSAVLGVITLPVQAIDLAIDGHALHKKQASKTSVQLRQLAENLNRQADNVRRLVENTIQQYQQHQQHHQNHQNNQQTSTFSFVKIIFFLLFIIILSWFLNFFNR